jgi:drug/metabolite transporter (DMT)-like permease
MVLSAFAFSWMTVFVKLSGRRLPWQEVVFARALVTLLLSYLAVRAAGVPPLGTHKKLLVVRGFFGFMGLSSVFYAVTHLPLAEATVLQYMYPPLTVLLASVALREPIDRSVVLSMAISVLGLILVAQPAALFGEAAAPLDALGLVAACLGAFFSACAYVTVRTLGQGEHPLVIVLYFPLIALPGSLLTALPYIELPQGIEWLWLLLLGIATQVGQVSVTRGLSTDAAGRMAAYSYVQVPFAGLWGVWLFHEKPTPLSLAGGALIIAGALVNLHSARRAKPAADLSARP